MQLSLLDRSRTRSGHPDAAALAHTVERARWAEEAGYARFWAAEHHGVPGVASGSPPVLLAAVGAATRRIRIGSGGVMLPHHAPIVVAEQFRMLEALHPGRVDLGLGRSLGFTEPVRRALRHLADQPDTFEADLAELRALLDGTAPVTVRPAGGGPVPMSVLATGRGLQVAARLGLPVVLGGPALEAPEVADAVAAYRRDFRAYADGDRPRVTVALDAYVAEDLTAARDLALPEVWAMARSRETGVFEALRPVEEIRAERWSEQVRRRVDAALDRAVAGTAAEVRERVADLVSATGADEVLSSTSTYDREALRTLDTALGEVVATIG
ncbi:MsnO8 family LLM class oxidoreductase [Nocardioides zeae]|uniref:MsnO8 family LLM class oxidoreductase n=1 Tax=Nocardioides imazamoxiresistens TaxID=3231893 RepID=A0ABU3Q1L9_9ACTN|nr:MsnO8 family LLM class oxidoreductase [Nocardioides zeae]MDT9595403.1 MsnO8 family LLM class oxidoreductase [Nocardioides zeae]